MRTKRLDSKSGCAVEITLSVIGGLWKPVILFHLLKEKRRFMELTRLMPNTIQRMLTRQLRELETDGIVARHVYPQIPPKPNMSSRRSVPRSRQCCSISRNGASCIRYVNSAW
jgi:DNA-binding HxlR family transcriptional regulator